MNWRNTQDRYGSLSIAMHWLMLLVMVATYAAINLEDLAPKGSALRADLKTWHFLFGMTVLALVALRLVLRLFAGGTPSIAPDFPRWQHRLAQIMHVALYVFMFGLPLLGWLAVSAKGDPVSFFGMPLPMLVDANRSTYRWLKEIHETLGTAGYYLIGLHAAAALFHHYVMHDNTLTRMLPQRG